jgi:glutathione synthase
VRLLFVMDPAAKMLPDKDTSFAFMLAAKARGHACFHCEPHEVGLRGGSVEVTARAIDVSREGPSLTLGAAEVHGLSGFSAVLVRKDPPFDVDYLHLTQVLEHGRAESLIVNDPRGLRDANEKLFAFNFAKFMPSSIVTSDREAIYAFVREVGGKAVIKPLDGAGGSGVLVLDASDQNQRAIVDLHTHEGERLVQVQEFLPSVRQGDKRVLLLDGKLLGAILRVPRDDEFRANIHVGGSVVKAELSREEALLVEQVGEVLRAHGLYFVGLDLVGGKLTEVNVTSPTGIQELERLSGQAASVEVICWLEARAASGLG